MKSIYNKLLANERIRRVVRNTGYLFSAAGLSAGFSMLQSILVARLLGVAEFGVLGAIITFTNVVNKLASFRMGELVVKYVGFYNEHQDDQQAAAVFKLATILEMVASLAAFGLVCLLAPFGARYFAKDSSASSLFIIYGLVVLVNLIAESSTGLLQTFDRFRRIGSINLMTSGTSLVLVAVVYIAQGDLLAIVMAYLAGKAVGALGLTFSAWGEAQRRWGSDWWKSPLAGLRGKLGEYLRFAFSTNISASINLINKDSELLWVSFFRTREEIGYYKLALSLANILELPVNPLPQATYPELSRQAATRNWSGMRSLLRQGSLLAGGYSLAAGLVLLVVGKPLIGFLYKPEFLPAYPALLILLAGYLVSNTFYWRRSALLSLERADYPAKLNLVLAVLKVAGALVLVPRYGYLASAALLAAFYWVGSAASVLKVRTLIARQEKAA